LKRGTTAAPSFFIRMIGSVLRWVSSRSLPDREEDRMKAIGIIFILLAIAIGIIPQFTNCSAQGRAIELPNGRTMPMKCHWTAMATPGVSVPLLLVGSLIVFARQRETALALSLLGLVLGVFAILLPTWLIGVCASDEMLCNIAMKPTLIFSGAVGIGTGAIGIVLAVKSRPQEPRAVS
jgi:hypothetical protein